MTTQLCIFIPPPSIVVVDVAVNREDPHTCPMLPHLVGLFCMLLIPSDLALVKVCAPLVTGITLGAALIGGAHTHFIAVFTGSLLMQVLTGICTS